MTALTTKHRTSLSDAAENTAPPFFRCQGPYAAISFPAWGGEDIIASAPGAFGSAIAFAGASAPGTMPETLLEPRGHNVAEFAANSTTGDAGPGLPLLQHSRRRVADRPKVGLRWIKPDVRSWEREQRRANRSDPGRMRPVDPDTQPDLSGCSSSAGSCAELLRCGCSAERCEQPRRRVLLQNQTDHRALRDNPMRFPGLTRRLHPAPDAVARWRGGRADNGNPGCGSD